MRAHAAIAFVSAALLAGCSGPPTRPQGEPVVFAADHYPAVFDAAVQALGEWRFIPDRIDAAHGVITTYPKPTAGLAAPWDREQSSLGDEGRDLLHQQEREVRLTFEPGDAPESFRVEVAILRVRRPGWRVETDALGYSSHATDPAMRRSGEQPEFREVIGTDPALEARIGDRIRVIAGLPEAGADTGVGAGSESGGQIPE